MQTIIRRGKAQQEILDDKAERQVRDIGIRQYSTELGITKKTAGILYDGISAEEARRGAPFLGIAYDSANAQPYIFLYATSLTVKGNIYVAATDSTFDRKAVVKSFNLTRTRTAARSTRSHDAYEFDNEFIEREFQISTIIRRRLGESFCASRVVCAISRFYSPDRLTGFIAFPFILGATDLDEYLAKSPRGFESSSLDIYISMHIHARMRRWLRLLENTNFRNSTIESIRREAKAGNIQAELLIREFAAIQLMGLSMASSLIKTVAELHSVFIFHNDIKPNNILVVWDEPRFTLLLRDFGRACAEQIESGDESASCQDVRLADPFYLDPAAFVVQIDSVEQRVAALGKFDSYAIGKVIARIFTPESDAIGAYPVITDNVFMPNDLLPLLTSITGEYNYSPPVISGQPDLRLSTEEAQARLSKFDGRETLDRVMPEFLRIVEQWDAENKL